MDPFDLIERIASRFIEDGFEPTDSEPGEWLEMTHPDGRVVVIDGDGTVEQQ